MCERMCLEARARMSSISRQPTRLWKLVLVFRKNFSTLLTELNLYENNIGDDGAKAIAEALKVNLLTPY